MKVKAFQFTPRVKCLDCGSCGKASMARKFNGCIFFILLLLGIIPGVLYLLAMQGKDKRVCSNCQSERVVPYK